MRFISTLVVFGFVGSAFGQTIVTESDGVFRSKLRPIITHDGQTIDSARGVWRARGYGFLAEVTDTDVRLFNETKTLIWQRKDVDPQELLVSISESGNQARIATHRAVPPFVVDRIKSMPNNKREPNEWTPKRLYDAFADTMTENYVFFKERSVNWEERTDSLRPKVSDTISESQLFELMAQSLKDIEDAHVQLGATIDGEPRRAHLGLSNTEKQGIKIFNNQKQFTDFDEFLESHLHLFEAGIANTVLSGNAKQACKQLTWGTTGKNVGYIYIEGMSDFSDAETLDDQLADLHNGMNKILTELANTRALIIDVSTNGGGMDLFSRAIASHFSDKRRLAFTKGPRNAPDIKHSIFVEPYNRLERQGGADKHGVTYTKPIYLVINDVTVSAAEIFVLCMKDLPHVTTIGKTTRGALSDVLSKTLPNGWAFGLSNEIYRDSQGKCFEAEGIPPNIAMTVIDPTKPDLGHAAAMAQIAALAD